MNVSRRSFLAAAGLALAAALSTVSAYGATRAEKLRAALDGRDRNYVFVTMHRGDWRHAPENSVDAIKGAIAMGADIVELDVALTKDGEYVLLHDGALDRVSNGKGKSKDLTLAEIRKFRLKGVDGKSVTDYEILTLKEALALTKGKILVNLDKFPRDPQGIAEYVRSLGMEKEVILKGIFMPDALKKKMKNQWAGIEDGTFYYMPIIWLNKADSSAAKAGTGSVVQGIEVRMIKPNPAFRGRQQPGQHIQQRGFAASAAAGQDSDPARHDFQSDRLHRIEIIGGAGFPKIPFGDVFRHDGHISFPPAVPCRDRRGLNEPPPVRWPAQLPQRKAAPCPPPSAAQFPYPASDRAASECSQ